ncbi:hypothetical protein SE17_21705 [Kouleothrix aurantiaca]|jgi:uncharacterized membrane protein YecN with MAPEG domain|uniref:Uncharacterized protein n=1 Tax=Kouleothrix aurantiaca TaxID=186479 RepID=A0A0N8PS01_9CHLR|nr:hypothetical protein SE17_21705 [Kouleothrix aurantiaca]
MFRTFFTARQRRQLAAATRDRSVQIVLWAVWTLAVVLVAVASWHADTVAQRPLNLLGMSIHCTLAGLVGLIIMTKIEMWLQPWRFHN